MNVYLLALPIHCSELVILITVILAVLNALNVQAPQTLVLAVTMIRILIKICFTMITLVLKVVLAAITKTMLLINASSQLLSLELSRLYI